MPPPPLVTTAGPPIMPNSPPASAGPIMVIPVHYSMLSPFPPPTPLTSMAPSTPSQLAGIMPSQPPLATPMVRMPNSPMVFQFPSPLPSPMAVVPPHQVFNFPTVTEFESEPYT